MKRTAEKLMTNGKFLMMFLFGMSLYLSNSGHAEDASAHRYFHVRSEIRSWIPGKTLETYKLHSNGSCSHGGSVGMGIKTEQERINVSIACARVARQIEVEVELKTIPNAKNQKSTETITRKFDMLDLRTQRIELAQDSDGRVFELTLIPEVVQIQQAKTFNPSDLKLQEWDFRSSPVILNDQNYVGQMDLSGATLVGVDIPGYATCEFSLVPWRDSKPTGTLKDGILNLKGKNISIMISGVHNGVQRQMLERGPYLVWTKWSEPKLSLQESLAIVSQQIKVLQKRHDEGDETITPEILRRMKEFTKSGKPMLMSSFGRDLKQNEIIQPEQ